MLVKFTPGAGMPAAALHPGKLFDVHEIGFEPTTFGVVTIVYRFINIQISNYSFLLILLVKKGIFKYNINLVKEKI